MSVFPDLSYKLNYNGLPIQYREMTGITAKSGFVGRVSDVQNLLAKLKYFSSDNNNIIMAAAELLDTVADSDEHQANECRASQNLQLSSLDWSPAIQTGGVIVLP